MNWLAKLLGMLFHPYKRIAELEQIIIEADIENGQLFGEKDHLASVIAELQERNANNYYMGNLTISCLVSAAGGKVHLTKDLSDAIKNSNLVITYNPTETGVELSLAAPEQAQGETE